MPNTHAFQIGLYIGLGQLASFLFEIPSGYLADKFGQKQTLVLSKILLIISTLSFIFAKSILFFIFGSIFLSISTSLNSGALEVLLHKSLLKIRKSKDFVKTLGKLRANASMLSVIFIIGLPFLTKINILLPIEIGLIFDIIGLITAFSLKNTPNAKNFKVINLKLLKKLLKIIKKTDFYLISIFLGLITGFVIGTLHYKEVYLKSLGLPVILVGTAMGLSRIFWYFIGNNIHKVYKNFKFKKILKIELFLFPILLIIIGLVSNPYIVIILFALTTGYFWGRKHLEINYLINKYKFNKHLKSTLLSIHSQIGMFFQFMVLFTIGFVMNISYSLGYIVSGIILFIFLLIVYYKLYNLKTK